MYKVQWCDHEGNLLEREFLTLEDALLEAGDLEEQYEGVRILDPNGNIVEM